MMILLGLPLLLLLSVGCASMTSGVGRTQRVAIDSRPHGAIVTVDGQPQGITPTIMQLDRRRSHEVSIDLIGYRPEHRMLKSGANGWVAGNVGLLGLAPMGLAVDLMTGSWRSLSDTDFTVELRK